MGKKKRWKKIVLWTLSVVVVLAVGGLFAANYAVDKLMNSMAEGFDLEAEETTATGGGQVDQPASTDAPAATDSTVPAPTTEPASAPATTPVAEGTGTTTPNIAKGTTAPAASQPAKTEAPAATESPDGYSAQVSTDKAKAIQENVTVKDKADVASIVLGQLSVSDIKRLQELASGGLTVEEKREARQIILGKVSEEQYNELSQIAKKYGVSRGITHDQAVKEEEQMKEANEKGSE
ncbi:hypothetical protein GCM10010912_00180 [Paenibacillus albidus]|uniref:Uncharacterized protein n=1 Tax=Paenibacillus albidus TaxID=2041023 RepID=A0A917BVX5_9BACL|nr:hypothetical protein [Paenibacillus albidus]GGF58967.1 hypothetical protein GCM10010912_00180 [Paenibacillus albidus]